ncbi:hypothetical protein [Endozoicomonas sp. Mp262]|uniref:hypothetical protein n=1 Tax=Endozoicomonas sp. Mp262 TaxID=2919499 RepID=UPI0021DA3630
MLDTRTEERLCNLETDMYRVKKTMLHRDEVREKVWNDLQEELLSAVKTGFAQQGQRISRLESDVSALKSDMSEIKSMLRQALKLD